MEQSVQPASRGELPRREAMQTPEAVAAMLRLKALGWGVRRIAGEHRETQPVHPGHEALLSDAALGSYHRPRPGPALDAAILRRPS